jgi:hypothetical protein
MRIRVIQRPAIACIDGIQLDHFIPGNHYEVSARLGCLFLAERWAEPVSTEEPLFIPSEVTPDSPRDPVNLVREIYPPYYDGAAPLAAARRSTRRRRRLR